MDTNIGKTDQRLRIAALIIGIVLYLSGTVSGWEGKVVGGLVIYCFMTALTRYSPVWELLGINTEKTVPLNAPPSTGP